MKSRALNDVEKARWRRKLQHQRKHGGHANQKQSSVASELETSEGEVSRFEAGNGEVLRRWFSDHRAGDYARAIGIDLETLELWFDQCLDHSPADASWHQAFPDVPAGRIWVPPRLVVAKTREDREFASEHQEAGPWFEELCAYMEERLLENGTLHISGPRGSGRRSIADALFDEWNAVIEVPRGGEEGEHRQARPALQRMPDEGDVVALRLVRQVGQGEAVRINVLPWNYGSLESLATQVRALVGEESAGADPEVVFAKLRRAGLTLWADEAIQLLGDLWSGRLDPGVELHRAVVNASWSRAVERSDSVALRRVGVELYIKLWAHLRLANQGWSWSRRSRADFEVAIGRTQASTGQLHALRRVEVLADIEDILVAGRGRTKRLESLRDSLAAASPADVCGALVEAGLLAELEDGQLGPPPGQLATLAAVVGLGACTAEITDDRLLSWVLDPSWSPVLRQLGASDAALEPLVRAWKHLPPAAQPAGAFLLVQALGRSPSPPPRETPLETLQAAASLFLLGSSMIEPTLFSGLVHRPQGLEIALDDMQHFSQRFARRLPTLEASTEEELRLRAGLAGCPAVGGDGTLLQMIEHHSGKLEGQELFAVACVALLPFQLPPIDKDRRQLWRSARWLVFAFRRPLPDPVLVLEVVAGGGDRHAREVLAGVSEDLGVWEHLLDEPTRARWVGRAGTAEQRFSVFVRLLKRYRRGAAEPPPEFWDAVPRIPRGRLTNWLVGSVEELGEERDAIELPWLELLLRLAQELEHLPALRALDGVLRDRLSACRPRLEIGARSQIRLMAYLFRDTKESHSPRLAGELLDGAHSGGEAPQDRHVVLDFIHEVMHAEALRLRCGQACAVLGDIDPLLARALAGPGWTWSEDRRAALGLLLLRLALYGRPLRGVATAFLGEDIPVEAGVRFLEALDESSRAKWAEYARSFQVTDPFPEPGPGAWTHPEALDEHALARTAIYLPGWAHPLFLRLRRSPELAATSAGRGALVLFSVLAAMGRLFRDEPEPEHVPDELWRFFAGLAGWPYKAAEVLDVVERIVRVEATEILLEHHPQVVVEAWPTWDDDGQVEWRSGLGLHVPAVVGLLKEQLAGRSSFRELAARHCPLERVRREARRVERERSKEQGQEPAEWAREVQFERYRQERLAKEHSRIMAVEDPAQRFRELLLFQDGETGDMESALVDWAGRRGVEAWLELPWFSVEATSLQVVLHSLRGRIEAGSAVAASLAEDLFEALLELPVRVEGSEHDGPTRHLPAQLWEPEPWHACVGLLQKAGRREAILRLWSRKDLVAVPMSWDQQHTLLPWADAADRDTPFTRGAVHRCWVLLRDSTLGDTSAAAYAATPPGPTRAALRMAAFSQEQDWLGRELQRLVTEALERPVGDPVGLLLWTSWASREPELAWSWLQEAWTNHSARRSTLAAQLLDGLELLDDAVPQARRWALENIGHPAHVPSSTQPAPTEV